MPITINSTTDEPTFDDYQKQKAIVKEETKAIAKRLQELQTIQANFNTFLANNPAYATYYIASLAEYPGLAEKFSTLETIAQQWIDTVAEIEAIDPLWN